MTKEPSKDFRQAVRDILDKAHVDMLSCNQVSDARVLDEATTRILALCKEMLVPAEKAEHPSYVRQPWLKEKHTRHDVGWNSARQHLLKQLGE